jgi:hypothetical protein
MKEEQDSIKEDKQACRQAQSSKSGRNPMKVVLKFPSKVLYSSAAAMLCHSVKYSVVDGYVGMVPANVPC